MGTVHIEDLRTGMVLSTDVRNHQGRILLSRGYPLDDLSIQSLRLWGIAETAVDGVDQDELDRQRIGALDRELARAAWEESGRRLRLTSPGHPALAELRKAVFIQMLQEGIPARAQDDPPLRAPEQKRKPDLARMAGGAARLASLPGVVVKVLEAVKDPGVPFASVAAIIGRDTALSAKLLKLVNSALYGFPEPVDTIARAVTVVGANRLASLALGVSLISVFENIPRKYLDMSSFLRHSLACAVLARLLALSAGHPNEERCFAGGLLHDIGRLAMLKNHSGHVAQAMAQAREEGRTLDHVERELWDFDHARLGGSMLASWNFPPDIERAVNGHHDPGGRTVHPDTALVHLADMMAHGLGIGQSGACLAPPLCEKAWKHLNIPPGAIRAAAAQAERQLGDISDIILGGDENTRAHRA